MLDHIFQNKNIKNRYEFKVGYKKNNVPIYRKLGLDRSLIIENKDLYLGRVNTLEYGMVPFLELLTATNSSVGKVKVEYIHFDISNKGEFFYTNKVESGLYKECLSGEEFLNVLEELNDLIKARKRLLFEKECSTWEELITSVPSKVVDSLNVYVIFIDSLECIERIKKENEVLYVEIEKNLLNIVSEGYVYGIYLIGEVSSFEELKFNKYIKDNIDIEVI